MKRILSLLLAIALAIALTGCAELVEVLETVNEINEIVGNADPGVPQDETEETAENTVPEEAVGNVVPDVPQDEITEPEEETPQIDEDGEYYSKDEVALYIHNYGKLPSNFITKKEAEALGWTGGSVERYAPGKAIGGDRYGNYEEKLAKKKGRTYRECDIDTLGAKNRGAKRIVFSNDGLIYYTGDHYETFELLYGEE